MHFYLYVKYNTGYEYMFGSFSGNFVINALLEPILARKSEQIQIVRCEVLLQIRKSKPMAGALVDLNQFSPELRTI